MTTSMMSEPGRRYTSQRLRSRAGGPSCYRAVWVTAVSGTDHAITDEVMAAGSAHSGRRLAVCGAQVLAASLVASPGPRCHRCLARLSAWSRSEEKPKRGRHAVRRPGLLDRLLRRSPTTPVVAPPLSPAVHPGRGDRSRTTAGSGLAAPTLVPPWPAREVARR